MPVGALQPPARLPARVAAAAAPPRLRPKGPVGPDFYRRNPASASGPRQSAVERLEADKAKYVKSQAALSRRPPFRAPESPKPPPGTDGGLRPTKKTPVHSKAKQDAAQLDLEHLSNLISDVNDGDARGRAGGAAEPDRRSPLQKKDGPSPLPPVERSGPHKVRLKASGPPGGDGPASPGSPAAGAVRRVDVLPVASGTGSPRRPPRFIRPALRPLHPLHPLHPRLPLRPTASQRRLPASGATPGPLKPVVALPKPDGSASPARPPALPPFPPPSPAVTRLSSSSSRKRPSLARSKSDMSDRFSRAGTELERFFNLCGLDPADLRDLPGSGSDIVSMARFRSVSAPGSECNAEEDEEDEDDGKAARRVPYGVSVIERNARVIKWLYGLRQAKDGADAVCALGSE